MTRRQNLERKRNSLSEIRDIMYSMKTLAFMETRKLQHFLNAQHEVVQKIEHVARDFLNCYPGYQPDKAQAIPIYLLIGSERGFCGDFNQALLNQLESSLITTGASQPVFIAIGRKLYTGMNEDSRLGASIDGASVVDEIGVVLNTLISELNALQYKHKFVTLTCLYHLDKEGIKVRQLLPPFLDLVNTPERHAFPPILHQTPVDFLFELSDQYLFTVLHEMLFCSLMAENLQRLTHLEGAVKHLDNESTNLARRCNALRQEEIIEEIEVIMLSAANLGDKPGSQDMSNADP